MVDKHTENDLAKKSEDERRIEKAKRAVKHKAMKGCNGHVTNTAATKPRGGWMQGPTMPLGALGQLNHISHILSLLIGIS